MDHPMLRSYAGQFIREDALFKYIYIVFNMNVTVSSNAQVDRRPPVQP